MSASKAENKEQEASSVLFSVSEAAVKGDCEKLISVLGSAGPGVVRVILDFKQTKEVTAGFISEFVQLSQKWKTEKKEILSLNVSAEVKRELVAKGVAVFFNIGAVKTPPIEAAKSDTVKPKAAYKLDTELINPFIEGVAVTFKNMLGLELTPEKPKLKDRKNPRPCDIAGYIKLNEGFNFSIAICFTSDVFLKVYEAMVGEKHDKISPETQDGASEILNIIYGHAKVSLREKGYPLIMAIPTVLIADKIATLNNSTGPTLELIFNCPIGTFHLEVNISAEA